jgi:micrococcal nuclease
MGRTSIQVAAVLGVLLGLTRGTLPGLVEASAAETLQARVLNCHDGDTCAVQIDGRKQKIRIFGIDAPEIGQAFGKESRDALERRIQSKEVTLLCSGRSYKRKVCEVRLGDADVAAELVKQGLAWDYRSYSRGKYSVEQAQAKREARGLWSEKHPVPPACARKKRKSCDRGY